MFGEDRHQSEDQRQFAIIRTGKIETNRSFTDALGLRHLDVVGTVVRPAFVTQQFPRENHVIRRHGFAIGKTRRRIDRERHVTPRVVRLDAIGEQAVQREWFVIAARQEALDCVAADIGRHEAFDDQVIEAVESAEHAERQLATLARRGIGIGRRAEIGWPGRLALHGDGVAGQSGLAGHRPERCQRCRKTTTQHRPARQGSRGRGGAYRTGAIRVAQGSNLSQRRRAKPA